MAVLRYLWPKLPRLFKKEWSSNESSSGIDDLLPVEEDSLKKWPSTRSVALYTNFKRFGGIKVLEGLADGLRYCGLADLVIVLRLKPLDTALLLRARMLAEIPRPEVLALLLGDSFPGCFGGSRHGDGEG